MDISRISKDHSDYVNIWSDSSQHYDLKASGNPRPKYVKKAINNYPAVDFTGTNVGLVSNHKYSNGPNDPFTWIMAVQPKDSGDRPQNIFSTSDNNWHGPGDFFPVAASNQGIHVWAASPENNINDAKLPKDELTIFTVRYDGKEAFVYWGMNKRASLIPQSNSNWKRGPPGYVAMGLALQNANHDYSGYIGEILAYDVALKHSVLEKMVVSMTAKWTTGKPWKESG